MSKQAPAAEKRIAIFGAGYTAAVAAEIVDRHPELALAAVTSRSQAGERFDEVCASWDAPLDAPAIRLEDPANLFEDLDAWRLDAALVTYPHLEANPAVVDLRSSGVPVVDLSADFRFRDLITYERLYGVHRRAWFHRDSGAVYGLTELNREQIREAELVANPGCYPTATVLGLAPLAKHGLIERVGIEAFSGISGAGKDGEKKFRDKPGNVVAYKNRHQPEIEQELGALGYDGPVEFQPHAVKDLFQGMFVRCEVTLRGDADLDDLLELYRAEYTDEPFVEVAEGPLDLGNIEDVEGTNLCRISLSRDAAGRIGVGVIIDNLWKGASGEAVQNLNLMLGLPEEAGLRTAVLERSAG